MRFYWSSLGYPHQNLHAVKSRSSNDDNNGKDNYNLHLHLHLHSSRPYKDDNSVNDGKLVPVVSRVEINLSKQFPKKNKKKG